MSEKKEPTASTKEYKLDELLRGQQSPELHFQKSTDRKVFGDRLKSIAEGKDTQQDEEPALEATRKLLADTYTAENPYGKLRLTNNDSHGLTSKKSPRDIFDSFAACNKEVSQRVAKNLFDKTIGRYQDWHAKLERLRHLLTDERDIHPPGKYIRIAWLPMIAENIMEVVTLSGAPYKEETTGSMAYPSSGGFGRWFHRDLHSSSLLFQHSAEAEEFCQSLCVPAGYEDFCIIHQYGYDAESYKAYQQEMEQAAHEKSLRESMKNHW